MRAREKILILLVFASLALGAFIYFYFLGNELEADYFRWLIATNMKFGTSAPIRFISEEVPPEILLYGGLGLFALVVLIVVLKIVRDGELLALRERLLDLDAEKSQTESLLQEEVWRGKHERQAKDYVTKDLEATIERIEKLIGDLNEKEFLLKARDAEITALKTHAIEPVGSSTAWESAPRSLRAELRKQAESLEASNATIKELEARLSAKTRLWESQLREKDGLIKRRESELAGVGSELQELNERFAEMEAAKKRAEHRLQEEIVQKKAILDANELVAKNEEKRLRERMRVLEAQLTEKDKLSRARDGEMSALQRQVTELAAAKEEIESRLQDTLGSADKDRQSREALIKDTERKYSATISTLQNEVMEKDLLLQVRDNELKSLRAEVKAVNARMNEASHALEQTEGALQEELRKERRQRMEQEAAVGDLEQRYQSDMEALRRQVSQKDASLKQREGEVESFKAQAASLAAQLTQVETAKERAAAALEGQIRKEQEIRAAHDSAMRSLEDNYNAKIGLLEKHLSDMHHAAEDGDSSEVAGLRSELQSAHQRLEDLAAAKDKAERLLQEALRDKAELARSKATADKEIASDFTAKVRTLESRLQESATLVQERDLELTAVKKQLVELTEAKEHTVHSLQETVRQNSEILQAKEAALKAMESRLGDTIRSFQRQLREKDDSLEARDADLKAIGAKAGKLTAQLAEFGRSKDQELRQLRDELRQRTELLQVKESAIQKLEERFQCHNQALQRQLNDRHKELEVRNSEFDALMAKISELTQERAELAAEREKSERMAQEELREKSALLQAKETSIGEVEEQLTARIATLERQLNDKQKLLESSGAELGEMRGQIYALTERLGEAEGAKLHAEALLHEERNKVIAAQLATESQAPAELQAQRNGESRGLDRLESERDELLKARDKLISDLMNELKEKKTALARHEIEVWRGIERRDAWKSRLSKIGIRLKD